MSKIISVKNGIDNISSVKTRLLTKKLGLITNASGVNKKGDHIADILADKFELKVLFSPEHGIRTNLQAGFWDGEPQKDADTGADIISLKADEAIIDAALDGIDTVVYDIQDVGARFYTYIYDLSDMMKRCTAKEKELMVLDRINPIGGTAIEGVVLDKSYFSDVGKFSIPTRYGLTVGELARYLNEEEKIGCKLHVVPVSGWKRKIYADETDLLWVNPSPNIPSVDTAINYTGTCIFEATNISEGRGTTKPFSLIGAPFVDSMRLTERMRGLKLDGVVFRRAYFTPKFGKYEGELCEGVELHITDRSAYDPFETALELYRELSYYREFRAREQRVCELFGNDMLCGEFVDPDAIMKNSRKELSEYRKIAAKYLMY